MNDLWKQKGALAGPHEKVVGYEIYETPKGLTISFDGGPPVYAEALLQHLHRPYAIPPAPEGGYRDRVTFTREEKSVLASIAETLAMLDGNAFFGAELQDGSDWVDQYLPEAHALWEANGCPPLAAADRYDAALNALYDAVGNREMLSFLLEYAPGGGWHAQMEIDGLEDAVVSFGGIGGDPVQTLRDLRDNYLFWLKGVTDVG